MPKKSTSKFSMQTNIELENLVLDALVTSGTAMTIDQIKSTDPYLMGFTGQKLTRILSHLNELGFIKKSKSKAQNRMVYKAVAAMEDEGFNMEEVVC